MTAWILTDGFSCLVKSLQHIHVLREISTSCTSSLSPLHGLRDISTSCSSIAKKVNFLPVSLVFLLVLLAACGGAPASPGGLLPPEAVPPDRLAIIDRALLDGDETKARFHLQAMLRSDPKNKVAAGLLRQIEVPASEFFKEFGGRYFTFETQGESFALIALEYLGDKFLALALAKYNGFRAPNGLSQGQTIRIPGTPPARAVLEERVFRYAQSLYDGKDHASVIYYLKSKTARDKRSDRLLVLSYLEQADRSERNGDMPRAKDYLESALKIGTSDKTVETRLQKVNRTLETRKHLALTQQRMNEETSSEARPALGQAPERDPGHSEMAYPGAASVAAAQRSLAGGDEGKARALLQAVLQLHPEDETAAILLRQIDQPAEQYFKNRLGERSFTYRVREGETLFSIARDFLGDQNLYYALGKYNRIYVQDVLATGQMIRVPGTPPPVASGDDRPSGPGARPQEPAEERAYRMAKDYFGKKRYPDVIRLLEALPSRDKRSASMLVRAYSEQAKADVLNDELVSARDNLVRALKMQSGDPEFEGRLQGIQHALDVRQYWAVAQEKMRAQDPAQAYVALREVLKRDPVHGPASVQFQRLRPEVIDKPLHACVAAYKEQQFDKAVDLCGQVLRIEPDHVLALERRNKALSISEKLKALAEKKDGE